MGVLPIDLQVLFTKASEHSENIARHANAAQSGQVAGYEKIHKDSQETDKKVHETEQYAEDFSKINTESRQKNPNSRQQDGQQEKRNPQDIESYRPAQIEEGKGTIIDIID